MKQQRQKPRHTQEDHSTQVKRRWQTFIVGMLTLGALLVTVATHPTVRHWLTEGASIFFVFGGVVAAPIMSVVGWIGLTLPHNVGLHQIAPTLFIAALVWFCLALGGAHAQSVRRAHLAQRTPDAPNSRNGTKAP